MCIQPLKSHSDIFFCNNNFSYNLIMIFRFINVSFKAIRDILQYFMPVIKNNIQRPPSAIGVDIMQEERLVEFFSLK